MKHKNFAMKRMRGVIDPITLGIILSLAGATTASIIHSDEISEDSASIPVKTETQTTVTDKSELGNEHLFVTQKISVHSN